MSRLLYLLPALLFLALAGLAGTLIYQGRFEGRDASVLPSALIDRPAPAFDLPPLLDDVPGFSRADLGGEPVLVNVFASWCAPCLAEHPLLTRLAEDGVPVFAIDYKDEPADARAFLARLGNPFLRIGVDRDGRTAIDWGVYGVPETFIVDAEGRIRHRHVGPLTPRSVEEVLLPILQGLRG